jgi:hypothetical protein
MSEANVNRYCNKINWTRQKLIEPLNDCIVHGVLGRDEAISGGEKKTKKKTPREIETIER